jgi:hypothetical protein
LNKEAAEVLQNNRRLFEQNVQKAMKGGYVGSILFERCLSNKWFNFYHNTQQERDISHAKNAAVRLQHQCVSNFEIGLYDLRKWQQLGVEQLDFQIGFLSAAVYNLKF